VLLSNGNLVEQGERWTTAATSPSLARPLPQAQLPVRAGGRRPGGARAAHPHRSGKEHLLQVYVRRRPGQDRARDELAGRSRRLGRAALRPALDLERFMIVAVSDFNMGAMENKGLNIFNTKYVLASPATATDDDFAASRAWSATSTSTTGPATASPAATGSSSR
jgi:aminopeptidase N